MMKKCLLNAIFSAVCLFFCLSCAARVSGSLLADGKADIHVNAALEPRMTMLLGSLAAASGMVQQGAPLLNGPSVSASMSAAPGVSSAALANKTPSSIEGPVKISQINDFLAHGKEQGFISFEQGTPSKDGKCAVNLSRESGEELLGLLSDEISAYLEALMAPLATGEKMTKAEYLVLVASVYGRGIADEISQAAIQVSIDFPGQVRSVRGGTFSGRKAEFSIPLLDLLVLEVPLHYEVIWR
ncbi:MAG: hypothetical protein FWG46_05570 [Treponema sp.]|nr:hypothetical protein [Treponema sp.]